MLKVKWRLEHVQKGSQRETEDENLVRNQSSRVRFKKIMCRSIKNKKKAKKAIYHCFEILLCLLLLPVSFFWFKKVLFFNVLLKLLRKKKYKMPGSCVGFFLHERSYSLYNHCCSQAILKHHLVWLSLKAFITIFFSALAEKPLNYSG